MKKSIIAIILSMGFLTGMMAQTILDPENFTEATSLSGTTLWMISKKGGQWRKVKESTLKDYVASEIGAVDTMYMAGDTLKLELTDGRTLSAITGGMGGGVSSVFGRTGAITASPGDYLASQITNTAAGSIVSTNVQDAINELATEKIQDTTGAVTSTHIAANAVGPAQLASTAVTLGTYGSSTNIPQITIDADGRITNAVNVSVAGNTFENGINKDTTSTVRLGGALTQPTAIVTNGSNFLTVTNGTADHFLSVAPSNIQIKTATPDSSTTAGFSAAGIVFNSISSSDTLSWLITPSQFKITDKRTQTTGITYAADYSAGFSERSLPDVGHVAAMIADSIANIQSATRPDTIEVTLYHTAVGSVIAAGASEHFQAVPSEWNGAIIVKVHYQQFVTGTVATNVGLEITADGGGVTNPFTGAIGIGNKNVVVTGSTALSTGDAIQVDVPSGTPDGQGLVAVLKIVMP